MQVSPISAPMMVGAPPVPPDEPVIMQEGVEHGNGGVVPPWLERAQAEHKVWLEQYTNPGYRPGGSPYDYGLSVDQVADMYRRGWHRARA